MRYRHRRPCVLDQGKRQTLSENRNDAKVFSVVAESVPFYVGDTSIQCWRVAELLEDSMFKKQVWFLLENRQQPTWRYDDEPTRSYPNPDAQPDLFSVESAATLAVGARVLPAIQLQQNLTPGGATDRHGNPAGSSWCKGATSSRTI